MKKVSINWLNYIAGLIDGEGSFCISVGSTKRNKNRDPYIDFNFVVNITQLKRGKKIFQDIINKLHIGNIYEAPLNIVRWQTKNHLETQKFLKIIIPYLKIKKESALKMNKALIIYLKNKNRLNVSYRMRGFKTHTQKEMLEILKLSQEINIGRCKRGKRKLNKVKYLKNFIKNYYPKQIRENLK